MNRKERAMAEVEKLKDAAEAVGEADPPREKKEQKQIEIVDATLSEERTYSDERLEEPATL